MKQIQSVEIIRP